MSMFTVSSAQCVAGGRIILQVDRLVISEGAHVLFEGASGSGKTTLLSLLTGLRRPDRGEVFFRGQNLVSMNDDELDPLRGSNFGFVMQGYNLIRHLSVADNLRLARFAGGLAPDEQKIKAVLERLDIMPLFDAQASALSAGETQRVAVARALMNDPAVIFADEPTSALDDINAGLIISLLREQTKISGAGLIVATHDARIKSGFTDIVSVHKGRVSS